jgi:PKD repeat protein
MLFDINRGARMTSQRRIKPSIGSVIVVMLTTAAVFTCLLSCAFAETGLPVSYPVDSLGELKQLTIPNTLSASGVMESLKSMNTPSAPQAAPVRKPMATVSDFDPILDSKWHIFWIEGDATMEDTITFLSPVDTSGSSPMLAVVSEKWAGGGGTFYDDSNGFDAYVQRSNGHWVVYSISFDDAGMPEAFGTAIHLDQDFNYVSGYNAFISLLLPIAANFSADVTQGVAPLTVTFTNATKGSTEVIGWDFGDGGSSDASDPVHVYDQAGSYTVTMEVSNSEDWDREQKTGYITVDSPFPAPVAGFESMVTEGNAPLTVTFSNISTGEITAQHWDFGDGQTSTEESPTHVYLNPGTYSVSLTVEGPGGSHTSTADDYIVVGDGSKIPCDCNGDGTISLADVGLALKMASGWPKGDMAINLEARTDAGAGLGVPEAICALRHISGVVNTPPVADAGPDNNHAVGVPAVLDGSGSYDPDGDPLSFAWTLTGKPSGSSASITGATTETPSFTPDVAGAYAFMLVVSDGIASSPGDVVTITAGVETPPLFNGFGFELKKGDFFEYQWDSKRVYWDSFSGSSTTNESGSFRVTLGDEKQLMAPLPARYRSVVTPAITRHAGIIWPLPKTASLDLWTVRRWL